MELKSWCSQLVETTKIIERNILQAFLFIDLFYVLLLNVVKLISFFI